MKIIIEQIKSSIEKTDDDIFEKAKRRLKDAKIFSHYGDFSIYKRSVDAREQKNVCFVCSVCASAELQKGANIDRLNSFGIKVMSSDKLTFSCTVKPQKRPLVVGFGPCGMFCALALAKAGCCPIVIERGSDVDTRVRKVNRFYENKVLDIESNIQFGAGGAGTFSDGKLTTRINDSKCAYILKEFVRFGAPEEIMTSAKPHIGTDKLRQVVKNISDEIISLGGTIFYDTKLLSFSENVAKTTKGDIPFSALVLAIGHSARDTYQYLLDSGFAIEPKPFSVGVRVEHLQSDINRSLYGDFATDRRLKNADYNVSFRKDNRGVYSFCMCPGGEVVCGASEENGLCVNGMSAFARNQTNANSAICVQIDREDYGATPKTAIDFQRNLEQKAFTVGGGNYCAPCQTMGDFYQGVSKTAPSKILPSYMNGNVSLCDMNAIFPKFVCDYLKMGFERFGKTIHGFDDKEVLLTGVETRTSAPIRIMRNENYLALGKTNVYPGGEGAGYAGGIMSSAVDGLHIAMAILKRYDE